MCWWNMKPAMLDVTTLGQISPVVSRYAILGKFNLHAAWEQDFHLECGKKELPALLGCSELGIVGPDEITCSWFHTHGGLGRNIPCDLHNKHVNKLLKNIIVNKSVSILGTIVAREEETNNHGPMSCHSQLPIFGQFPDPRADPHVKHWLRS